MKFDILLCGVGGQGVLSLAAIIAQAALNDGQFVKQSEVHGMAQRGGAVSAHLRIASNPIASDLIARGDADMILSMEPLEALRYREFLNPLTGVVVSTREPFVNIDDYPETQAVYASLAVYPNLNLVDATALAKQAANPRATNMVLVGAAAASLPVSVIALEAAIASLFGAKGDKVVQSNIAAFRLGLAAATPLTAGTKAGQA